MDRTGLRHAASNQVSAKVGGGRGRGTCPRDDDWAESPGQEVEGVEMTEPRTHPWTHPSLPLLQVSLYLPVHVGGSGVAAAVGWVDAGAVDGREEGESVA